MSGSYNVEFDLQPPSSHLSITWSSFDHPKNSLSSIIASHPLNCAVEIFIPNCGAEPKTFISAAALDSFQRGCISIANIVQKQFVDDFISKGTLSAVSHSKRGDVDDVLAVVDGHLVISATKDTYERLGLQGKPSKYSDSRFYLDIDLQSSTHNPEKKGYQRVLSRVSAIFPCEPMLFSWRPSGCDNDSVLPIEGLSVESCKFTKTQLRLLKVPVIEVNPSQHRVLELFEWLGMMAIRADRVDGSTSDIINCYLTPEPFIEINSSWQFNWTGFISSNRVQNHIETARQLLSSSPKIPWIAITFIGFSDAPSSWARREHAIHEAGDNGATIIVFQDNSYIIIRFGCGHSN